MNMEGFIRHMATVLINNEQVEGIRVTPSCIGVMPATREMMTLLRKRIKQEGMDGEYTVVHERSNFHELILRERSGEEKKRWVTDQIALRDMNELVKLLEKNSK